MYIYRNNLMHDLNSHVDQTKHLILNRMKENIFN